MRTIDRRCIAFIFVTVVPLITGGCNSKLTRNTDPADTLHDADHRVYSADADLWDRLRDGMELDIPDNPRVRQFIDWYLERPAVIARMEQNAGLYLFHIVDSVERREMPLELALLPAIESNYTPTATSHAGAAGIWQFVRSTGRAYGLEQTTWYDARRDLLASTDAALDYLGYLNDFFDGDWELALAAYNAGEGKVSRVRGTNERRGADIDYWSLDLPRETEEYVPRLLALASIVKHPQRYGIELDYIPNRPQLATIETSRTLDLAVAAQRCGLDKEEFRRLNAAYTSAITVSRKKHRILVPAHKEQQLRTVLASLPETKPPQRRVASASSYTVKAGDTLSSIAGRFGISAADIRARNGIRNDLIKVGQRLALRESGARSAASAGKRSYRVKSGDSLWSIARSHNVTVEALRRHNRMARKAVLRPGQVLKIPALREAAAQPTQTTS